MIDEDDRHLDPAGALASQFEEGSFSDATVPNEEDREELIEFVDAVENGDLDRLRDPGLEATYRIARALLENND